MQLVAVLSFLTPATNAVYPQRLFFVGLAPFLVLVLRFLLSDETQIWLGICGSLFVGLCFCFLVVSAFRGLLHVHGHSAMYFSSFYHFYFCQNRASGNIGRTGGKKKSRQVVTQCLCQKRDSRVDQQGFEPPLAVCQRWQDQRHTN